MGGDGVSCCTLLQRWWIGAESGSHGRAVPVRSDLSRTRLGEGRCHVCTVLQGMRGFAMQDEEGKGNGKMLLVNMSRLRQWNDKLTELQDSPRSLLEIFRTILLLTLQTIPDGSYIPPVSRLRTVLARAARLLAFSSARKTVR